MSLSYGTRMALGDNSSFLKRSQPGGSVTKQIGNARNRLQAVGVDTAKDGEDQNFLLKALDIISRPGYGATNTIREFTNPYAGSTPQTFDPLAAFWRGIKGQDKAQGKDIFTDIGMEGEKGIFGGEAKWYNPSPAGAAGLALDIFNPLDPVNWVSFGVGDDLIKGTAKGTKSLTDAFGSKGSLIADILKSHKPDVPDIIDNLGAQSVGKLASQITSKVDEPEILKQVAKLIEEGIAETGKKATDKLDYRAMKPLQVGLQNPLSIGNSGMSVKLPGYEATGGKAKLPIMFPGKDIESTFRNIPGSEYATYAIGNITKKIGSLSFGGGTTLGQSLGKLFSNTFVPNTVPNAVIKKDLTASNVGELINLSKTSPTDVPLSAEELMALNDEMNNITVDSTFNLMGSTVTEMKKANKGTYLSVENLAKKVGLKNLSTDDIVGMLSDTPFNKSITELYDSLRTLNTVGNPKDLFVNATKLRKIMDLMYDQIPEGIKPYFTGVLKPQMTDMYPTDITTHRLGNNIASSPLMAYEFNYKGVPISVVVNSGDNFNVDAWAKMGATIEALNELPEEAIQALKGQIDVSPVPIKNPDTSMTIGDTIVLGRVDKSTVAHEYGHIWDKVSGDPESYSKAIMNDAQKNDNTITSRDLYSDYSRSIYDTDKVTGIKEDLADSVSDYLSDRKIFKELYPGRAQEIEKMLKDSSISQDELAKLVAKQRGIANSVASVPRTETQIKSMIDSVDEYAHKLKWEAGDKTYQSFRKNLSALYEQTNWKTKQWHEQVATIFKGIDEVERKQIMDAAAQITGTEIPGVKESAAEPLFAQQNYPVFMSKLQEVVDKMPNKMPINDFKNYLNSKQVKKEELKWAFMDELMEGKTPITKQEVQDWVKGNTLEVQEVWYGKMAKGQTNEIANNPMNQDIRRMLDQGWDDVEILDYLQEYMTTSEANRLLEGVKNPEVMPTKFSQYTQPGGEDYTELIFTLPRNYAVPKVPVDEQKLSLLNSRKAELQEMLNDPEMDIFSDDWQKYRDELNKIENQVNPMQESTSFVYPPHWDNLDNPVAHTRFDTRYTEDGKKVLFVDEIQSDWHQQGRDRGYKDEGYKEAMNRVFELENKQRALEGQLTQVKEKYSVTDYQSSFNKEYRQESRAIKNELKTIRDELYEARTKLANDQAVEDAPFKTNWDEFVQKRILRYAADNGYDGIAWSTGKQQAQRWQQDITENVDTLQYNQESNYLRMYKNGGRVFSDRVDPSRLAETVGADIARKLLDTTPGTYKIVPAESGMPSDDLTDWAMKNMPENMDAAQIERWLDSDPEYNRLNNGSGFKVVDENNNAWSYIYNTEEEAQKAIDDLAIVGDNLKTVSGANITVGGEGMRKFYDQQIPSNFKKLGKKFGLSVEEIELNFSGNVNKVHPTEEFDDAIRYYFDGDDAGFTGRAEAFVRFGMEEGDYSTVQRMLEDIDDNMKFPERSDVDKLLDTADNIAINDYNEDLDLSNIRQRLYNQVEYQDRMWVDEADDIGDWNMKPEYESRPLSKQQGIWLDPKSRQAITQQSFPLFADNMKPQDNLTAGWSERQITALDNFLKWRNSVVKQYKQIGIPINELEKYVPFIPKRVLKKDEASLVRNVFGTGAETATADNFDTLMAELTKMDPNLKKRTTQATRPSEVNKLLKNEWLTEDAAVAMSIRGTRAIKAQEFNQFADDFVKEYGLHATDLNRITGTTVPEGYVAYKVGVDPDGNKIFQKAKTLVQNTADDIDTIFLPEEMVKLYEEYLGLAFNKESQSGLLKIYDSLTQMYKKAAYLWNPGHILRDFEGNVYNNYLMGVQNPAEYAEGLKIMMGTDGTLDTPNGPIPYKDIYDQAQRLGIIDSVMAHELPTLSGKKEGAYSKMMRQATYATDGWTRTTGFIHNLKQGQSFTHAAATTKKFLFDYFDLTPFERKVMKRVIPFYTWMRKNIPLQMEVLLKNPRIFARIADIQNAAAGEVINWDEKPDYIQNSLAIKGENSNMYTNLSMPFQDLANVPINSESARNILSSVNPLVRAPIESITNQKWWTGRELESYKGEKSDIPVLTTLMETLGVGSPKAENRYVGNVLDNMPILTRAGNLLDTISGKETSEVRNLSRVSSTFGGPAVYDASSVDSSADWQERQRLIELIQRLQDEGYEIPTTKELKKEGRYKELKRKLGGR